MHAFIRFFFKKKTFVADIPKYVEGLLRVDIDVVSPYDVVHWRYDSADHAGSSIQGERVRSQRPEVVDWLSGLLLREELYCIQTIICSRRFFAFRLFVTGLMYAFLAYLDALAADHLAHCNGVCARTSTHRWAVRIATGTRSREHQVAAAATTCRATYRGRANFSETTTNRKNFNKFLTAHSRVRLEARATSAEARSVAAASSAECVGDECSDDIDIEFDIDDGVDSVDDCVVAQRHCARLRSDNGRSRSAHDRSSQEVWLGNRRTNAFRIDDERSRTRRGGASLVRS